MSNIIGEKVTHKVRLSLADAHYAGELVNGAKMLDFFGDVGTELAIRLDGDESLLLSYEHVDMLQPIYAGDIMEYTGWFTEIGNTSRKLHFEAYKVVELCRDENLEVSAARVLPEKLLCGTADMVAVTPKKCQRGPQDPAFKID